MKKFLHLFVLAFCLLTTMAIKREVAIIVHPDAAVSSDKKEIKKIFMGKSKTFPGSSDILAVVAQPKGTPLTKRLIKRY